MRSASERLVRKLYRATEGLGGTREVASDAERRGWVATVVAILYA